MSRTGFVGHVQAVFYWVCCGLHTPCFFPWFFSCGMSSTSWHQHENTSVLTCYLAAGPCAKCAKCESCYQILTNILNMFEKNHQKVLPPKKKLNIGHLPFEKAHCFWINLPTKTKWIKDPKMIECGASIGGNLRHNLSSYPTAWHTARPTI